MEASKITTSLVLLSLLAGLCNGLHLPAVTASTPNRTAIFLQYASQYGENVFIRGGISSDHRAGCTDSVTGDPCAIPIRTHLMGTIPTYDGYNAWRVNDNYLDWHGAEPTQGTFGGVSAAGTPMAWTTNDVLSPAYQPLNQFGSDYWFVDMEMDCSQTEGGWFEFKGYIQATPDVWENDVAGGTVCTGTNGGTPPYTTTNHMALCGYLNTFTLGVSSCQIDAFTD